MSVRKRGFVLDLLGRPHRSLIQPMSKALDYPIDVNLTARCREDHIQQNLPFEVELESLRRVHRFWFRQNHNGLNGWGVVGFLLWRFNNLIVLVDKCRRLHGPGPPCVARWGDGYAVAKSSAGNGSSRSGRSARAVPIPGPRGQSRVAKLRNVGMLVRVARTGQALRVAEPARLDFIERKWFVNCRNRRAATGYHSGFHGLARPGRLIICQFHLQWLKSLVHLWKISFHLAHLRLGRLDFRRSEKFGHFDLRSRLLDRRRRWL